jgi:hypothetical protein
MRQTRSKTKEQKVSVAKEETAQQQDEFNVVAVNAKTSKRVVKLADKSNKGTPEMSVKEDIKVVVSEAQQTMS